MTVTVKNIGNKSQGFSPSDQKLIDTEGREHEPDVSAALLGLDGSSANPIFEDINPGNKVTGQIVFDIPKGRRARSNRAARLDVLGWREGVAEAVTP